MKATKCTVTFTKNCVCKSTSQSDQNLFITSFWRAIGTTRTVIRQHWCLPIMNTVCVPIASHAAVPGFSVPTDLNTTGVLDDVSIWFCYWIARFGFSTTDISSSAPESVREMSVLSPRQSYLAFNKSIHYVIRFIQLTPVAATNVPR